MKFIYSYTTHQNERREGLTISAPNRDAAYSELNKRGIRPYKLHPAPGVWNKMSAVGGRGLAIIILVLIVGVLVTIALAQHKDNVQYEQDGDRLAVFKWLEKVSRKNGGKALVINVAGPRESKEPGLAAAVEKYIAKLIEQ